MHDYKFRQSDSSFDKRRGQMRKMLFAAVALLLGAGIVLVVLRIDPTGESSSQKSEAESDVIPLSLPPKPNSSQATGELRNTEGPDSRTIV